MSKVPATLITLALAAAAFAPAQLAAQDQPAHIFMTPQELKWSDVPSLPRGAQIAVIEGPMNESKPFTARLKFPADYQIPAHTHPTIEHVTVISGSFHMGMGNKLDKKQGKRLGVGAVAVMQPGTAHYAWTTEPTVVQLHGVGPWGIDYVNPADDPRGKK